MVTVRNPTLDLETLLKVNPINNKRLVIRSEYFHNPFLYDLISIVMILQKY